MNIDMEKLNENLVAVASEFFRFQKVFEKAIEKLDLEEQMKYRSQFAWFAKQLGKALQQAHVTVVDVTGQSYDPGMAVVPLNIDDFETGDELYIVETIEPIVMQENSISKLGRVILGRTTE